MDVRKWPMHLSNWLTQIFVPKKKKKIKFLKEKDAKQKRRRAPSVRRKIKRHFERLGSGRQFDRRTHVKGDLFSVGDGIWKNHFLRPSAAIETTFIHSKSYGWRQAMKRRLIFVILLPIVTLSANSLIERQDVGSIIAQLSVRIFWSFF